MKAWRLVNRKCMKRIYHSYPILLIKNGYHTRHGANFRYHRYYKHLSRPISTQNEVEIIPTTLQPAGFAAWDKSINKPSAKDSDGRRNPFERIHHVRARFKNDFEHFDAVKEFSIHPILTPIVPLTVIGAGIYIIVTGVIANPPGDDDDEDDD